MQIETRFKLYFSYRNRMLRVLYFFNTRSDVILSYNKYNNVRILIRELMKIK